MIDSNRKNRSSHDQRRNKHRDPPHPARAGVQRGEELAEPPAHLDFAKSLDAISIARDYLVRGWPKYVRVLSAVIGGCEQTIHAQCRIVLPLRNIIRATARDHALALIWIFDKDDGNQTCEETSPE